MQLEEFLHPSEQIRATAQIDYDKGARVLFGVTNARCFVFEDTKREQSFTSSKVFNSIKITRPKMNILLVIIGVLFIIAAFYMPPLAIVGLVIILISWWRSKIMLLTASVGSITLVFIIKKFGQIQQMIQFMQFVHC